MTRIISGEARGRRLAVPPGTNTRPTGDRAREALFNALDAQLGGFADLAVLDLFAGSGAIGLEALSRGAARVLMVEADQRAAAVVVRNLAVVQPVRDPHHTARVVTDRAERVVATPPADGAFDVAFLDPPYAVRDAEVVALLTGLGENGWLAEEAVVVLERSSRDGGFRWPEGYEGTRAKDYGEARLSYAVWYGRGASHD
jgi:16S rRNA (guanine966-N2)-methyltransferase